MASVLQALFDGIQFGSIILLAAVGLSLLYGVADFPNFAHGAFLTVGAYIAYAGHVTYSLPFVVAAMVSVVGTAALGVFLDRTLLQLHRESSSFVLLIVTVGVAFILRSIVRMIWGNDPLSYGLPVYRSSEVFGISVGRNDLIIIVLGAAFALATHLLLTRTKIGIGMRATSDNESLAMITGIDTDRIITITWAIVGALTAVGGIFLGVKSGVVLPRMGFDILLVVFAAVILGGIGSPYGAMLGAYVIGVAQELMILVPGLSTGYRFGAAFLVMIVVLLFYPHGIAGARGVK